MISSDAIGRTLNIVEVTTDATERVLACRTLEQRAEEHTRRIEKHHDVEESVRAQIEQAAVTAERNRIARDLHDSVTQTLFSANLIAEVLPRLWERDPAEARSRMEEMRQLTRGALAEMRMLLLELRPATLSNVPLGDLLKQLADAAGGRGRIPVTVTVHGDGAHLPLQAHNALYRIAQEALNNIAKHSGATLAEVSLDCDGNRIEMKIIDNGKGFDSTALGSSDHLGLSIMRERAQEIGAELKVESGPGCGTRVFVQWRVVA